MANFSRSILFVVSLTLAGCASTPTPVVSPRTTTAPPPMTAPVTAAPSAGRFIAPRVMSARGLEDVIGQNGTALANVFGAPRLETREGDALKLQFTGEACVLDIYLYPLSPGREPSATHVETRRASDGQDVDRLACVNALRRVPRR